MILEACPFTEVQTQFCAFSRQMQRISFEHLQVTDPLTNHHTLLTATFSGF